MRLPLWGTATKPQTEATSFVTPLRPAHAPPAGTPMSGVVATRATPKPAAASEGRPVTAKVTVLLQHLCSRAPDRTEYRTQIAQVTRGPSWPR